MSSRSFAKGLVVGALMLSPAAAEAQTSVVTQIGYVFPSISRVSMSDRSAVTFRGSSRSGDTVVGTSQTTYAIATNEANGKIIAHLDADMPQGMTLSAQVAAPVGGWSAGQVALSSSVTDVVTGIGAVNQSNLLITYSVNASAASSRPATRRTVVYTIIAGM